MKKLLLVLAIGAFAACNNAADTKEEIKDSVINEQIEAVDEKRDTTKDNLDSAANQKIDSLKEQKH